MTDKRWQLVTCAGCGKSYVCTPEHDYYNATTASDGVCETCLTLNAGLHPDKTVTGHYDWQGNPISLAQWSELFGDERHIGHDTIDHTEVSTVYLGLDHQPDDGPPLIFETMIFSDNVERDQTCWRYATVEQARAGHERVVAALREGREP